MLLGVLIPRGAVKSIQNSRCIPELISVQVPTPKLKITGRRLDSQTPPLDVEGPNAVGVGGPPGNYMIVGLTFPTPGCWEITGHDENDELTFVVWVAK